MHYAIHNNHIRFQQTRTYFSKNVSSVSCSSHNLIVICHSFSNLVSFVTRKLCLCCIILHSERFIVENEYHVTGLCVWNAYHELSCIITIFVKQITKMSEVKSLWIWERYTFAMVWYSFTLLFFGFFYRFPFPDKIIKRSKKTHQPCYLRPQ